MKYLSYFFAKKPKARSLLNLTFAMTLSLLACVTTSTEVKDISNCATFDCGHLTASKFGGTLFYFRGNGFDDQGYDNQVYFGPYPCEVDDGLTFRTMMVCRLPYMFYDVSERQEVAVIVKGRNFEISSWDKDVEFAMGHTPVTNYIYPSATWPGQEISVYGIHRVNYFIEFEVLKVGSQNCSIHLDDIFSLQEVERPWGHWTMNCAVADDLEVGAHKFQATGKPGTGYTKVMRSGENFRPMGDREMFHVMVHPLIESVSPSEGYMNGQKLTITGIGFGKSLGNVAINIGGVSCIPEKVTNTEISCIVQKTDTVSDKVIHFGNAGLQKQTFKKNISFDKLFEEYADAGKNLNDAHNEHPDGHEDKIVFISTILSMEDIPDEDNFVIRTFGVFLAPTAGEYTFYTSGNQDTRLYLSSAPVDESVAFDETSMMQLLCDQHTNSDIMAFFQYPDQSLCTVTLEAGEKYYMIYMHREGTGWDHYTLAVEVPNTDNNLENTIGQVQEVKVVNPVIEEVQIIKICKASSGTFSLIYATNDAEKYETKKSLSIDWNASAHDFRTQVVNGTHWHQLTVTLKTLDSSGAETDVEESINCREYTLTFSTYKGDYKEPFVNTGGLKGGANATMQIVTHPSPPVTGNFKLKYNGHETPLLSNEEWHPWMKYKLESIPDLVGGVSVHTTGSHIDGRTWYISMDSVKGTALPLQVAENNLSGGSTGSPTISIKPVHRAANTNLFYNPIHSDFLTTFHSKPQVILSVNGMRAACPDQNCDYDFITNTDTLEIESYDISSNPISMVLKTGYGNKSGAGLLSDASNISVQFGGYDCGNVSFSSGTISCSLPEDTNGQMMYEAGDQKPIVFLKGKGYLINDTTALKKSPEVTSVSPSQGSTGGGTLITISGKHFSADEANVSVSVGPYACAVQSVSYSSITCLTGAEESSGNYKLTVTVNGKTFTDDNNSLFSYGGPVPTITSMDKSTVSPILKQVLTISGSNFGNDPSKITVHLVPKTDKNLYPLECFKVDNEVTDTSIKCHLTGGKSGDYQVQVTVDGVGKSKSSPSNAADLTMEILFDPPTETIGSLEGGHLITITGTNFSSNTTDNQVIIGNNKDVCFVEVASPTELKCRTRKPKEVLNGPQPIYVFGRITEEAKCSGTCEYQFAASSTPTITQISPVSVVAGDTITITGTKLKSAEVGGETTIFIGSEVVPSGNITNISGTSITFSMPESVKPQFSIQVHVDGRGYAQQNQPEEQKLIENPFKITSIGTTSGLVTGTILEITGNGFLSEERTEVWLSWQQCHIQEFSHSRIVCFFWWTPGNKGATVNVEVTNKTDVVVGNTIETEDVKVTCDACKYTASNDNPPGVYELKNQNFSDLSSISMSLIGSYMDDKIDTSTIYLMAKDQIKFPKLKYQGTMVAGSEHNEIVATFTNVTAGEYRILYHMQGLGFAGSGPAENISLTETNVALTASENQSYMGGHEITFTGAGFLDNQYKDQYDIKICGNRCEVTESSESSLKCRVPMLNTKETQAAFNMVDKEILSGTDSISDKEFESKMLMDNDYLHGYKGNESCYVGWDFGENRIASVSKIRIFPTFNHDEKWLMGAVLEGANDGIEDDANWTTLATVDASVVENWNSYLPENLETRWEYRYFRLRNTRYCQITEFELTGRVYNMIPSFDINNTSCDVSVKRGEVEVGNFANGITYSADKVSVVTGISPEFVTTGGNESVTITGTNLDKDGEIIIDNIPCVINKSSSSDTSLVCTTGPRPEFTTPTIKVKTANNGDSITRGQQVLYADRWSNTATWGGESLPRKGDLVHVPRGQTLLVDVDVVPRLASIVIEGIVMFEDYDAGKTKYFDSDFIMINGGSLYIGTEQKRYESKLVITLHGERSGPTFPGFGNKNIMIQDGTVDIHGKHRNFTWTDLNESVVPNDTTITVREQVDWQAGEEIIIAPTSFDIEEYERRFIKSVTLNAGDNTSTIVLDRPLDYKHFAKTMTYDGKTFDARAEVGLMTRNILIRGDENSLADTYGVHIIMRGEESKVKGRFSYFEMVHAGQSSQFGRYPIHFHMIGNAIGSYVEGCSIHDTFNRATTIHDTHYLQIKNNVYHNHVGHAVFIEDGVELNNVIEDNLIIYVLKSNSMLTSDTMASGIWTSSPQNFFKGNHVSACEFFAFWFDIPAEPTGPSANKPLCPRGMQLGHFRENVGHTAKFGFRVYPFLTPRTNMCEPAYDDRLADSFSVNEPVQALFEDNIAYSNGTGCLNRDVGHVVNKNLISFNNSVQFVIASPKWGRDGQAQLIDSLLIGRTELGDFHNMGDGFAFGTARKDGFLMKDTTIMNFQQGSLLTTCNGCNDERHRDIGGRRTTFENIKFLDVTGPFVFYTRTEHGEPHAEKDKDIFFDKTGSVIDYMLGTTGSTGGWVTPWNEHLNIPECQKLDSEMCEPSCAVCSKDVDILRLEIFFNESQSSFEGVDIKVMNLGVNGAQWSPEQTDSSLYGVHTWRNVERTENYEGFTINLASGYDYNLHFGEGIDWKDISLRTNSYWEDISRKTTVRFNSTEAREEFKVTVLESTVVEMPEDEDTLEYQTTEKTTLVTAPGNSDSFGDFYHSVDEKLLTFKLNGVKRGTIKAEAKFCSSSCPSAANSADIETEYRYWSEVSAWGEGGKVPEEGDDVEIEETWNMVVDVETAIVNSVTIKGRLSFIAERPDSVLNVKTIDVDRFGEFLIGKESTPFAQNAKVKIHGSTTDTGIQVGIGVPPLTKGVIVRGKMKFYGARKTPIWTVLRESAMRDASTIKVETTSGMNWQVGDKLVIGSSSTDMNQVDEGVIKTISADGTIELEEPIAHFHYGAASAKTLPSGEVLEMRAEIGNLSRNIKIESTDGDAFGCSILVPKYSTLEPEEVIQGSLTLDSVEIMKCGQKDSMKGAINLLDLETSSNPQKVMYSSIWDSQGKAVTSVKVDGFSFTNNVIYNSRKYGIYLENDKNTSVENNLMIKVRKRDTFEEGEQYDLIHGIYRNNTAAMEGDGGTTIRNNRVSSVEWFAYTIPAHECSSDEPNFSGNVAHSSKAGWFAHEVKNLNCQEFSNFHAFKNTDEGFVNRQNGGDFSLRNMVLADNGNAFAVNGGTPSKEFWGGDLRTKDIEIYGRALPDCAECYEGENNCEHNGIYTSLFNETPYKFFFELTRMPLHNSTNSQFNIYGRHYMENVRFENFSESYECAKNAKAIRVNNFYQNGVVSVFSKNVTLENVDENNKFYFPVQKLHGDSVVFCGKVNCTGVYNVPIFDLDGSLSGGSATHYLPNNDAAKRDPDCTYKESWNGHECNPKYAQLNILNPEKDRSPSITPATLEVIDYDEGFNQAETFKHDFVAHHKIVGIAKLGHMHSLQYFSKMPSGIEYQLVTPNESADEYIILKVYSENPAPMYVSKNGNKIINEILTEDEKPDFTGKIKCGTNFYIRSEQILYFVLTGEETCRLTIKNSNAIALNARLDISVEDFYKNDGVTNFIDRVAATLGISMDRIRVVRVYTGSTHVDFVIEREESIDSTTENKTEAMEELEELGEKFKTEAESGNLDLGAPLIGLETELQIDDSVEEENNTTSPGDQTETPEEESGSGSGLAVGLGVGIPLALIVLAGVGYAVYHFKFKKNGKTENVNQSKDGSTIDKGSENRGRNLVYLQEHEPLAKKNIVNNPSS